MSGVYSERRGQAPARARPGVVMPRRLTAENGAKGALLGEFEETLTHQCQECDGSGDGEPLPGNDNLPCEECGGTGEIQQAVPVSWTTIKAIYAAAVKHFHPGEGK